MRLYSGSSQQFINDTVQNQIAEKLKLAFFNYFRFYPSPAEVNSWRNSLRSVCQVFQHANLLDHGVILEYQLPLTSKRLDCMICGRDKSKIDNAVIIELKQWEKCEEAFGENEVLTWVGGAKRETLHPSVQVGQYKMYLEDTHTAFNTDINPISLNACTYLHNYNYYSDDVIYSSKYENALKSYPLFTADDVDNLKDYLGEKLVKGDGIDVLKRVEESKYRPSKKLMDHVGNMIKGRSEYILLDEQLVVYDTVLSSAKKGFSDKQQTVIIIKGGPGTGKSVIAINLMADLLLKGYNSHYATGSRAFTTTLRKIIGSRGSAQFKYFNSYSQAEQNAVDVIIADEAHRIRKTSNSRFTHRDRRSDLAQIDELLRASKVAVFFIDDNQVVRPDEIGSSEYIKLNARNKGSKVFEYKLEAQFRCNGSDAFVNWINNTLGIERTANVLWDQHEEFDFRIFSSPQDLENAIKLKVREGFTGRVTAGFCWDWSNPREDGTLIDDVVVGDYSRPWDARPEARRLAPGIPPASLWAYDPNGINQVGCIYTAQGFEFDYVGIIFGEDLIYDFDKQDWAGNRTKSADSVVKRSGEKFTDLVKNTYRVLLSRGMKGCYVYFINKDTERFFKSRIEKPSRIKIIEDMDKDIDKILSAVEEEAKFNEYLPVYSLEAVATTFGREEYVEQTGWMKVSVTRKLTNDMFIAKVVGKSMEPTIPDGRFCIFRLNPGGSRNGLVVLVESRLVADPETNQKFTIKRYSSEKEFFDDGTWRHKKITLSPDNETFSDIVLENVSSSDFRVVAEFIDVI